MNSKNKGNTFERKIANMLSEAFKEHTGMDQAFRRNVDSGSFFGGSNQARTKTHNLEKASFGDIVCPDAFKFSIECKHYKTPPSFASILKQDCGVLDKWIAQGKIDAESSERKMLLIAKFNNVPEMAIVTDDHDLPHVMKYKGHLIVPLTDFMKQEISFFFGASDAKAA